MHIAQNEKDEERGEENTELLINYESIDRVAKQNIRENIIELMKRDNLVNFQNAKRIHRV